MSTVGQILKCLIALSVLGAGAVAAGGAAPPSAASAAVAAPRLAAEWLGELDAGGAKLRLALHLRALADGSFGATVDSLDQGAMGLTVDRVSVAEGVVRFEMKALMARFEGRMAADGKSIVGQWTQGPASLPLTFVATDAPPELRRPQEPRRPLPYREEQVRFPNAAAGIRFAGTLTLPPAPGTFPAVVLLSGSGPEDRDETIFGHRPFLVLADFLTRRGIAVLRFDDRGVGGSSAGAPGATSEDFAGDALAAVAFLKSRPEIDQERIGLIGHSEGATVAAIAAARSREIAFIVLLAGPGLPGEEILHLQSAALMRAAGLPEAAIAQARAVNQQVYGAVREGGAPSAVEQRVRQALTAAGMSGAGVESQLRVVLDPWFRHFLTFDPRTALARVRVPLLALGGERDLQVPPGPNLAAIRAALAAAGQTSFEVRELAGLNHLFQSAPTGAISEYARIEETISPVALEIVATWISARAPRSK